MAQMPATRGRQNWIFPHTMMQQWLDDFFTGMPGMRGDTDWMPRTDIYEEGNTYVMELDLPGMKRDNINITCTGDTIKITGTREHERTYDENQIHRMERVHGAFSRQFTLPSDVDADKINAEMKDGVLRVIMPKSQEKASEKTIQIQ